MNENPMLRSRKFVMEITASACCLVFFFFLQGCKQSCGDVAIEFDGRVPPAEDISDVEQRDAQLAADFKPDGNEAKLIGLYKKFNMITASGLARSDEIEKLYEEVSEISSKLLEEKGAERLNELVAYLTENFMNSLGGLLSKLDPASSEALLEGRKLEGETAALYEKLVQWGADFIRNAAGAGLIKRTEGRLNFAQGGKLFVRIAYKVRFSGFFKTEDAISMLLTPTEKKWYYIWVAERSKTASMERKLLAISGLAKMEKDYPVALARGIVHYNGGKYDLAVADFEHALAGGARDKRIRCWLEKAKEAAGRKNK